MMPVSKIVEIRWGANVACTVAEHETRVATQRRDASRISLVADDRGQHLDDTDQHGGGTCGVLADHMEHGID